MQNTPLTSFDGLATQRLSDCQMQQPNLDDRMRTTDDDCGGDPPCWMHLFEDELDGVNSAASPVADAVVVDLAAVAAAGSHGPAWTNRSDDLDVNLLVFAEGEGVAEHVNDQVDVLLIGMTGNGVVTIDGRQHELGAGTAVVVPKGASRGTRSLTERFAYLTCHRRRPGLIPVLANRSGA
jgi:mannose-6-phosphate isomerase-like protein (cupin superfamily)